MLQYKPHELFELCKSFDQRLRRHGLLRVDVQTAVLPMLQIVSHSSLSYIDYTHKKKRLLINKIIYSSHVHVYNRVFFQIKF